jgi:hypothetical protein
LAEKHLPDKIRTERLRIAAEIKSLMLVISCNMIKASALSIAALQNELRRVCPAKNEFTEKAGLP